jgi:hypothetical protein
MSPCLSRFSAVTLLHQGYQCAADGGSPSRAYHDSIFCRDLSRFADSDGVGRKRLSMTTKKKYHKRPYHYLRGSVVESAQAAKRA